jgi:hypothetical protein
MRLLAFNMSIMTSAKDVLLINSYCRFPNTSTINIKKRVTNFDRQTNTYHIKKRTQCKPTNPPNSLALVFHAMPPPTFIINYFKPFNIGFPPIHKSIPAPKNNTPILPAKNDISGHRKTIFTNIKLILNHLHKIL